MIYSTCILRKIAVITLTVLSIPWSICRESTPREVTFSGAEYDDILTISRTVPLYEFHSTTQGEFVDRFCDTIVSLNPTNSLVFLDEPYYFERSWLEGDLHDYLYVYSQDMDARRLQSITGAIALNDGGWAFILSANADWLDKMPFRITDSELRINYGTDYKTLGLNPINNNDYTAALKIMGNGKVDPVSIRRHLTSIQHDTGRSKFKWIERYYKEHGLPAGCGYYTQVDLEKIFFKR